MYRLPANESYLMKVQFVHPNYRPHVAAPQSRIPAHFAGSKPIVCSHLPNLSMFYPRKPTDTYAPNLQECNVRPYNAGSSAQKQRRSKVDGFTTNWPGRAMIPCLFSLHHAPPLQGKYAATTPAVEVEDRVALRPVR